MQVLCLLLSFSDFCIYTQQHSIAVSSLSCAADCDYQFRFYKLDRLAKKLLTCWLVYPDALRISFCNLQCINP